MRLKSSILIVILAVLSVAAWFLWPSRTSVKNAKTDAVLEMNNVQMAEQTQEIAKNNTWIVPMIRYDTYESGYGTLPPSLEGTNIPFNLQVDEQGELVVNESLRRLFDYFFTTDGEEPIETILARIVELLEAHLPETAQGRAIDILHQYYELKLAEIELARQLDADFKASGEMLSLAELRRAQRDLRASNLAPEVYEAFYGVEGKLDDYAVDRIEIQRNTSLTDEEREAALIAIEQTLPIKDREKLQADREKQNMLDDVKKAKENGASDAEIFQVREQVLGAKIAQRYADADSRKMEWDSRITAYRDLRAEILNATGMTEGDKEYELEQLRAQHFQGNELKRIPVIDRMMDSSN